MRVALFSCGFVAALLFNPNVSRAQSSSPPHNTVNLLSGEKAYVASEEMLFPQLSTVRVINPKEARTGLGSVWLAAKPLPDTLISKFVQVKSGQKLTFTVWVRTRQENSHSWVASTARALTGGLLIGSPQPSHSSTAEPALSTNHRLFPFVGLGLALGLPSVTKSSQKLSSEAYFQVRFYDQAGKFVTSQERYSSKKAHGWQQLSLTVNIQGKGLMRMVLGNAAGVSAYFDDVKVKTTSSTSQVATLLLSSPKANVMVKNILQPYASLEDSGGGDPAFTVMLPEVEVGGYSSQSTMLIIPGGGDIGGGVYYGGGPYDIPIPSGPQPIDINDSSFGQLGAGTPTESVGSFAHFPPLPDMLLSITVTRDQNNCITGYHVSLQPIGGVNGAFTLSNNLSSSVTGESGSIHFSGYLSYTITAAGNSTSNGSIVEYSIVFNPDGTVFTQEQVH